MVGRPVPITMIPDLRSPGEERKRKREEEDQEEGELEGPLGVREEGVGSGRRQRRVLEYKANLVRKKHHHSGNAETFSAKQSCSPSNLP